MVKVAPKYPSPAMVKEAPKHPSPAMVKEAPKHPSRVMVKAVAQRRQRLDDCSEFRKSWKHKCICCYQRNTLAVDKMASLKMLVFIFVKNV
jgi:hypothetical protein